MRMHTITPSNRHAVLLGFVVAGDAKLAAGVEQVSTPPPLSLSPLATALGLPTLAGAARMVSTPASAGVAAHPFFIYMLTCASDW